MPNAIHSGDAVRSFGVSAKTLFLDALKGATPPTWERIGGRLTVETDEVDFPMLKPLTSVREWVGDRVYQTIESLGWKTKIKKFEKSVEINRDHVENDNIGLYRDIFSGLGQLFRRWPDERVWALWKLGETELCYDGQPFFSTSHPVGETVVSNFTSGAGAGWYVIASKSPVKPVYFLDRAGRQPKLIARDTPDCDHVIETDMYRYNGDAKGVPMFGAWQATFKSKATLDHTNLNSAITAMRSFKDEVGESLNMEPDLLVVDPTNQVAAEQILNTMTLLNGASNTNFKKLELLVVNRLG